MKTMKTRNENSAFFLGIQHTIFPKFDYDENKEKTMTKKMSKTKSRLIHNLFLMLSPFGSSILFVLINNPQTVVGNGLSMPLNGESAPLVYLFFGVCLIFWVKVYENHPHRTIGWVLVVSLTVFFILGCAHVFPVENTLPPILIWIGSIIPTILLS